MEVWRRRMRTAPHNHPVASTGADINKGAGSCGFISTTVPSTRRAPAHESRAPAPRSSRRGTARAPWAPWGLRVRNVLFCGGVGRGWGGRDSKSCDLFGNNRPAAISAGDRVVAQVVERRGEATKAPSGANTGAKKVSDMRARPALVIVWTLGGPGPGPGPGWTRVDLVGGFPRWVSGSGGVRGGLTPRPWLFCSPLSHHSGSGSAKLEVSRPPGARGRGCQQNSRRKRADEARGAEQEARGARGEAKWGKRGTFKRPWLRTGVHMDLVDCCSDAAAE